MSAFKKLFSWKAESEYKTFDEPPIPNAPVVRVNLEDLEDDPPPTPDGIFGKTNAYSQ
jgi:hypothetical protein